MKSNYSFEGRKTLGEKEEEKKRSFLGEEEAPPEKTLALEDVGVF